MSERNPSGPPDPRLRRRTFLGGAAAIAGAASLAPAAAQTLGTVHPPLVAENDPAIAVQRVTLEGSGIPAYAARPATASPSTPGVVVVMHIWGVDVSIRDVTRRLAKVGFAAIAPDLYAPFHAPSGDGATDFTAFQPYAQRLQDAPTDAAIRSAALWLHAQHPAGKIAVTGFCMGGTIALRQAVTNADVFAADVVWYGKVAGTDPRAIAIPLAGNYGMRDRSIPAEGVYAFEQGLRVPHDIVEYPDAGHAFFDDQRASYVAADAQDAWRRTIAFFTKYLQG